MDVFLRVAERYQLAIRVAERVKRGDTIGDPKQLLAEYKALLAKFSEKEKDAESWLKDHQDNEKLQASSPMSDEEKKVLREMRDGEGKTKVWGIIKYLGQHGFMAISNVARLLCLSILQQLVLPPKTRKSVEAASKFWMRNVRTEPHGKNMEETYVKRVELYVEHLIAFRKYERLFDEAVREGKVHSDTGDVITRYKAGPFSAVNTGGFDDATMTGKAKLCEEAAAKMAGIGLGKVCYGDVLITNRLSGESTQAFYLVAKDEMFVRADAKMSLDTVQTICHELTHRLEEKFLSGKKKEIVGLYRTINTNSIIHGNREPDLTGVPIPKAGEEIDLPKFGLSKVIAYDFARNVVKLAPRLEPGERAFTLTMPLLEYNARKGISPPPRKPQHPLDFITPYAKRGGPSENFAEMVAHYATGNLPKEQVELLLPIIS